MTPRTPVGRRPLKSLASSSGFEAFAIDQLSELGEVVPRKMFGGVGLYCDGLFFGLIARDQLYLKVDDQTRAFFEAAGSTPFRPYDDRPVTMQYYAVPVDVLESAPELRGWARRALGAASRAAERSGRPGKRARSRGRRS
jgi:DNA transformation protein and related proteins